MLLGSLGNAVAQAGSLLKLGLPLLALLFIQRSDIEVCAHVSSTSPLRLFASARAGLLAVSVAFQHLLPDGRFNSQGAFGKLIACEFLKGGFEERVDDGDLRPVVEPLHEALWFFLFG